MLSTRTHERFAKRALPIRSPKFTREQLKDALSGRMFYPYGWALLMDDGASVCERCARAELRLIFRASLGAQKDGWYPEAVYPTDGDECERCAHCDGQIEAAFCEHQACSWLAAGDCPDEEKES